MRNVLEVLETDRWQPIRSVIEEVSAAEGIDVRAVQASVRRLMSRGLIEVSTCRSIVPDLGGNDRLARRVCQDPDADAIAQHSARVRLVFDELLAIRRTLEDAYSGSGGPRDWWQARDRAHHLRHLLARLVGRREVRRLLDAAGYPADAPLTKPMPLADLFEAQPA
jgi:hypothetical protein